MTAEPHEARSKAVQPIETCTAKARSGRRCRKRPEPGQRDLMDDTERRVTSSNSGALEVELSEVGKRANAYRPLTHSLDLTKEGLMPDRTHAPTLDATKRGLEPEPLAPLGPPSSALQEMLAGWPERFRTKVDASGDGCWLWVAHRDPNGYGRFGQGRNDRPRVMRAHRYAFRLAHPEVDIDGLVLDHLCRTPACVRPDHLEVVTQGENILRGAAANSSGWCRAGLHEWTSENILTEPPTARQPNGVRRCRPCRDAREKRYRPTGARRRADA